MKTLFSTKVTKVCLLTVCTTRHKRMWLDIWLCNEMKGNIFALKFLISYPDIIQYVIHTLLLFILFLYWEMLKNVTAAIRGTLRIVKVSLSVIGPECLINHIRAETGQKRDLCCAWPAGNATCLLNVQIWSNFWQQSYPTLMYSILKYVQRVLVFYEVEILS